MNIVVKDKTYTTTIPVKAGSTKNTIFFPTIDNLDGKFTNSLETFLAEINVVSTTNTPLANSNLLAVTYINLVIGDVIWIWNLQALKLVTLNNQFSTGIASSPFQVEFNSLAVIWAKSFLFIADVTQIDPAIDQEFQFEISYQDIPPPKL